MHHRRLHISTQIPFLDPWSCMVQWKQSGRSVVYLANHKGSFSLTLAGLPTKSDLYTHMSGIHLKLSRMLTSDVWNLHRCFPAPFERTNCEATQLLPLPEMIALSASRSDQLLYQTKHLWCPTRDAIISTGILQLEQQGKLVNPWKISPPWSMLQHSCGDCRANDQKSYQWPNWS